MDTQTHPPILQADPGTNVRTTVGVPEDLWQAVGLLALRRKCSRDDIFTEALRMLFASFDLKPTTLPPADLVIHYLELALAAVGKTTPTEDDPETDEAKSMDAGIRRLLGPPWGKP